MITIDKTFTQKETKMKIKKMLIGLTIFLLTSSSFAKGINGTKAENLMRALVQAGTLLEMNTSGEIQTKEIYEVSCLTDTEQQISGGEFKRTECEVFTGKENQDVPSSSNVSLGDELKNPALVAQRLSEAGAHEEGFSGKTYLYAKKIQCNLKRDDNSKHFSCSFSK
jgi:hypothetical protein